MYPSATIIRSLLLAAAIIPSNGQLGLVPQERPQALSGFGGDDTDAAAAGANGGTTTKSVEGDVTTTTTTTTTTTSTTTIASGGMIMEALSEFGGDDSSLSMTTTSPRTRPKTRPTTRPTKRPTTRPTTWPTTIDAAARASGGDMITTTTSTTTTRVEERATTTTTTTTSTTTTTVETTIAASGPSGGKSTEALSKFGGDDSALSMMAVATGAATRAATGGKNSKSGKSIKITKQPGTSSKSMKLLVPAVAVGPSPPAPFCRDVGAACSSGELLEGVGITEKNTYSDTIDGCPDGTNPGASSVEKITVSGVDGQLLQAGSNATIEAVVLLQSHPNALGDRAEFYYADTVNTQIPNSSYGPNNGWAYLGTTFRNGTGPRTLEMRVPLKGSGIQAVRVQLFSTEGIKGFGVPCRPTFQSRVDHDDLVFYVAKNATW